MRKDGLRPERHLPWDPATRSAAQHHGRPGSRGLACKTQQLRSFGSRTTDSLLKVTVCPPRGNPGPGPGAAERHAVEPWPRRSQRAASRSRARGHEEAARPGPCAWLHPRRPCPPRVGWREGPREPPPGRPLQGGPPTVPPQTPRAPRPPFLRELPGPVVSPPSSASPLVHPPNPSAPAAIRNLTRPQLRCLNTHCFVTPTAFNWWPGAPGGLSR